MPAASSTLRNKNIGVGFTEQRAKNVWYVSKISNAHKEKNAVVFTSVSTIAECLHANGNVGESVKDPIYSLVNFWSVSDINRADSISRSGST